MKSLTINEFIDKFNQYLTENNIILNLGDNIFKLAAYQYLKFPAIQDYYTNVNLFKDKDVIEVGIKSGVNLDFLDLNGDYINVSNRLVNRHSYILNIEESLEIEKFIKNIKNSNNFFDLKDKLINDSNLIVKMSTFLNLEEVKFLHFINNYDFNNNILNLEGEVLNEVSFIDLMIYTNLKYKSKDIENLIKLQNEKFESDEYLQSLTNVLGYDGINFINDSFKRATHEDKVKYFKSIINQNPDSLTYTLINSDNLIYDIVNKFIYPDLKNSIHTKFKYSLKNKKIEDLLNNEHLRKFKEQIISEYPELNKPLVDRLQHFIWTSDMLRNQQGNFKELIDKCEIYDDYYNSKYFKAQFEHKPKSTHELNSDFLDQDVIFIGKDNFNPFYIIQAEIDTPLSMNADSIEILSVSIGNSITKDIFIEALDNIFLYALQKKEVLHFSQRIFFKTIEGFENEFETIVNKYKGIVPTLYYDNEFEKDIKYRTVVETELDYDQIIEIDLYIDELKKKGKNANEIFEMAKEKVSNISLKDNFKNKREI